MSGLKCVLFYPVECTIISLISTGYFFSDLGVSFQPNVMLRKYSLCNTVPYAFRKLKLINSMIRLVLLDFFRKPVEEY